MLSINHTTKGEICVQQSECTPHFAGYITNFADDRVPLNLLLRARLD